VQEIDLITRNFKLPKALLGVQLDAARELVSLSLDSAVKEP